jgi:hypothetical protein
MEGFVIMKKFKLILSFFLFAMLLAGRADADIFYAVSNYSTGSAGIITKGNSEYSVKKNVVTNFGVDAAGFTFNDHNGNQRAMIREYNYGPNDPVYIWDPSDWSKPIVNKNSFGSNIHAAASSGQYLYLATYESYAGSGEDTGEVVRVDMKNGYVRDRAYHYERFTSEGGNRLSPHAEAIYVGSGKIYALFGMPYNGVNEYEASEIVEFDSGLNVLRKAKLEDASGKEGRNPTRMAYYGGKLYIACMGGYQGPGSWGDVWEVDISAMTARQVLDGHDIPYTVNGESANVGMYGIDFAPDGTAFLLSGSYDSSYMFRARLFVTTAARLAAGDAGTSVKEYTQSPGYSWDILWDGPSATLWCMTGRSLEARNKAGALLRTFTPAEVGDNIYSISLLNGTSAPDSSETPDDPDDPDNSDNTDDPDSPDNPDTQIPSVSPAAPDITGAPVGVGSVAPIFATDRAAFSSLTEIPSSWLVSAGGFYGLSESRAKENAGQIWGDVRDTRSLPAFTAMVAQTGDIAAVGFDIDGADLLAKRPSGIKLIKALTGGKKPLQFAYSASGYGDGTFRLQTAAGRNHTGAISSGTKYRLVMFIKDGGDYDLASAKGTVADPAVLVSASDDDTGDGGGKDENNGSNSNDGGGGGCDGGTAGGFALALFACFVCAARFRAAKR